MIVVFLPPFPFRGEEAPFLWFFYKLLSSSREPLCFIAGAEYLVSPEKWVGGDRWEFDSSVQSRLNYSLPDESCLAAHHYSFMGNDLFLKILDEFDNNPKRLFEGFLTQRIAALEADISRCFGELSKYEIEAVISLTNCPSLEFVARARNLPVIHVELGPLRAPHYTPTAYFDFAGVNGNSEAAARFFSCTFPNDGPVTSVDELRQAFCKYNPLKPEPDMEYVGLVFQVEDDSNIVAYSNGYDNVSLLTLAKLENDQKKLLVRSHPGSFFQVKNAGVDVDFSPSSIDFVCKCKKIYTINSSVALDAVFFGVQVKSFGDSSFNFILDAPSELEVGRRLAFYLFNYLVPFDLAFDPDYIRFRLASPNEMAIASRHSEVYLSRVSTINNPGEFLSENALEEFWMKCVMESRFEKLSNGLAEKEVEINALREEKRAMEGEIIGLQENIEKAEVEYLKKIAQVELEARNKIYQLEIDAGNLKTMLDRVRGGFSWKVTLPFRVIARLLRGEYRTVIEPLKRHEHLRFVLTLNLLFSRLLQLHRQGYFSSQMLLRKYKTLHRLYKTGGVEEVLRNVRRVVGRDTLVSAGSLLESGEQITILATKHTQYVAHLLHACLAKSGFSASVVFNYDIAADSKQLYVVVCPQMFPVLPERYVAFQMEQSVSSRWFTDEYFSILKNAVAIWEYSEINIEFLLSRGIPYQKIFFVPIDVMSNYPAYLDGVGISLVGIPKDIDVLFYGDPSAPRRKAIIKAISDEVRVHVASEVFGEELIRLVARSRLVVNIHYYEGALLETTRISEVLSLGVPVVSEEGTDQAMHPELYDIVEFCKIGDIEGLINRIKLLLGDQDAYERRLGLIDHYQRTRCKTEEYVKRFLLANDLLSFDTYFASTSFLPIAQGDIPRYCLTLSETPARKSNFLQGPANGFQIVEGVRHVTGWVGCGLSYKYILSHIRQRGFSFCMVCEDDVVFGSDFGDRINSAVNYMQSLTSKWCVFSGLIAHLHPDAKVIEIDCIDGVEYIHLNKMTSMIMNIYSCRGMDLIARWDYLNRDVHENAIDRFLESQEDLVVVTSLPFIVGHAEDLNSTLWGFVNTQYVDLIAESEMLLRAKVEEFKKNNPVH